MTSRLAWRSLWRNRRRTLITILSIGLGLSVAIFFIALGEGVYDQIVNDAVRMQAGHITLEHPDYTIAPAVDLMISGVEGLRRNIEAMDSVERTKLLVLGQGVAMSGAGGVGVSIMGVEPSMELKTSPLARRMVAGEYLKDDDMRMAVVGALLAKRLKLKEGSKLVLTTNNACGELVEELYRVRGIFSMGSDEIDGYLIQIPLSAARGLFGLSPDSATQLGVILKRADAQQEVLGAIEALVDTRKIGVFPWQTVLPELAAYIRIDRASNWVFQGLLFVIILFTIFNTLLMSAVEREHEFAVLLALGTPLVQLKRQMFMESVYIGLMGCALGAFLGGAASLAMERWGLDFGFLLPEGVTISGFTISTRIYAQLTTAMLFGVAGIVLGATLFLSFAPMRRVGRLNIAEMLR